MRMYKTKYGQFSAKQLEEYKTKLHNQIHWFLIYYENQYEKLDEYFEEVQYFLNGLDEVLSYPMQMIQLIATIECARQEFNKPECNFRLYRKAILDAHSIINNLPEWQDGDYDD